MHVQDALADAVQQRNAPAVAEGLLRGGRADKPDKAGRVPVLLAAAAGHVNVLQAILQHSKDRVYVNLKTYGRPCVVLVPALGWKTAQNTYNATVAYAMKQDMWKGTVNILLPSTVFCLYLYLIV